MYPTGIARDPGTFGTPDPSDPARLVVTTSRQTPWTRKVSGDVPSPYVPGPTAPVIVGADGPDPLVFATLDNLIAQKRIPVMVGISVRLQRTEDRGRSEVRGRRTSSLEPRTYLRPHSSVLTPLSSVLVTPLLVQR